MNVFNFFLRQIVSKTCLWMQVNEIIKKEWRVSYDHNTFLAVWIPLKPEKILTQHFLHNFFEITDKLLFSKTWPVHDSIYLISYLFLRSFLVILNVIARYLKVLLPSERTYNRNFILKKCKKVVKFLDTPSVEWVGFSGLVCSRDSWKTDPNEISFLFSVKVE